ncbi:hypothetical protein B0H15DRAFT_900610 [Mycena belliarum]|uniref:Uncharacterized protein n=1 Tax=Mycena belliarum TaxID=1033014 RepID=A0AAD6UHU3_9AGAR|nr:hypothetical protein B0H15DRAFT_900610 [Mycena belliae]
MPMPSPALVDKGWQAVSPEWWRIPYNAVSWAYSASDPPDIVAARATQSPRVAKPPHYHAALFYRAASVEDHHDEDLADWDDGRLNPDLVGFKGAVAAIESYEIDVGFNWSAWPVEEKSTPDLTLAVDEDHVALGKERWDELVQDLTGGLSIANTDRYQESDEDSLRSPHRSTSAHSSVDLTDSERSVLSEAMPATPRVRRSYANIVVKDASPSRSASSRDSDRSPRRLNAAASSFVPSPSKAKVTSDATPFLTAPGPVPFPTLNEPRAQTPPSPSFNTTFVFPSLNVPPLPAVKITKDAQGFYCGVESPAQAPSHTRTSSTLLPAFLDAFTRRRPPASKTRAIVDRLKSSASGEPTKTQEAPKSYPARPQLELSSIAKPRLSVSEYGDDGDSPPIDDDGEGWIGIDETAASAAVVNPKTRRTRDLFLALTRRRSSSSPPKSTLVETPADDVVGIPVELPSPSSSSSNDGWIEGPALLRAESKPTPPVISRSERKATPLSVQAAEPKPVLHRPLTNRAPKRPKRSAPAPQTAPVSTALYARPPPYYYPPAHRPIPVQYAGYMHPMQVLQLQQQQQMHMRHMSAPVGIPIPLRTPRGSMSSAGSGEWYQYPMPVSAYPVPMPVLHAPPVFVPRGA